jgi:hypothetical protein
MTARHAFMFIVLLMLANWSAADELLMKNGSRLIGKLVSASESEVIFDTPFAGQLKVQQANIVSVVADQKVTLMMKDGTVYRDKQIVSRDERMLVMASRQQPVVFDVADMALVNPEPWRIGDGYKWFGQLNSALAMERGNTDTDELDIDFESIWRSLEDRYTLRGAWELDETNGVENKDASKLRGKYDRFSARRPDDYLGFQLALEQDKFADLNLRTTVGPYLGRQYFDTPLLTMHAELGLVFVEEDYNEAPDDDYWGSNWEVRLSSDIIPDTELYVHADGIINFTHLERQLVNTTIGIGLPILYGLKAGAEIKYEYNGGAVQDVDKLDETYQLKFGYSW